MKALIVEDDATKLNDLVNLLKHEIPKIDCDVAKSFHVGLNKLVSRTYDVIIFDMTMPNYEVSVQEDGGQQFHFGGRELMRQMKRKGISAPVIVFTQFDNFGLGRERMTLVELKEELDEKFPFYRGTVSYSQISNRWMREMMKFINSIEDEGVAR